MSFKRCEAIVQSGAHKGERCRVPVCRFGDGRYCVTHSHSPEAREVLRAGRLKGALAPKVKTIKQPGLKRYVRTCQDLVGFSNHLKWCFLRGAINAEQFACLGAWAGNHRRLVETLEVSDQVAHIRDELEVAKGDGPPSDKVIVSVLHDADGAGIPLRQEEEEIEKSTSGVEESS